jgi:putative ABC transport system permease protein
MIRLIEDVRYGLRFLGKSPAFTLVAVLTLALGIGANTAIFSLLDQALLRALPVKEPNRLVLLRYTGPNNGYSHARADSSLSFSYPMYRDLRDHNAFFSGLISTASAHVGIQWHNEASLADAELVSGNYFDVLGVQPALGRMFVPSEDVAQEAAPVAVLGFSYWQGRFAADPKILNQTILINGHPFTVVGVAAPGFRSAVSGDHPAVFVPMTMKPEITPGWNDLEERRSAWLNIIGRLKPELRREQAEAGIAGLWYSIRAGELKEMGHSSEHFKDAFLTDSHLFLIDGSKGVWPSGGGATALWVVMAMAGLMLLIACANVGCLWLVRVASRAREISVRYALGAKRSRILAQLLVEGLLLGFAGGTAGVLAAPEIATLLTRILWSKSAGGIALSSRPDLRILAFNFGLTLGVSLLFSLAPALAFRDGNASLGLQQSTATVPPGSRRLRQSLVVAQICLSLLLLVAAGLFVRTLHNLQTVNLGFTTSRLVTFSVDPRLAGYDQSQTLGLYQRILDGLESLAGTRLAAATSDPELANDNSGSNITVAGYEAQENEDMNVETARVSSSYFATLGMPLLAGRQFSAQDRQGTQKVAIVNRSFAGKYFGTPQNAIGGYFCWGAGDVTPDIQIVGVVEDARHANVRDRIRRTVFTPFLQENQAGVDGGGMTFYVRTAPEADNGETTIRQFMHRLDRSIALDNFRTMQEQMDKSLAPERAIAFLASSFGTLAALMAAIGIYGVLAYSSALRVREFGIRIAVGASSQSLIRMVFVEAVWMVGIGVAAGLPLATLLARAVRARLFGIPATDPLALSLACVAVIFLAIVAGALPARRAARIDPVIALRSE